jgi:flagellar hook-basal body complex protein FliE
MSDPIGAISSRLGALQGGGLTGGLAGGLTGDLKGALSGGVGGTDGAKRYTFDIGKGDGTAGTGGPSFGDTLTKAINQVSEAQDTSSDLVQRFMRGDPVELHQVMAASEEAGIALEVMIATR